MNVHILGNGPSISLFNIDRIETNDIVIGCNLSDINLKPDYTIVIDISTMKKIYSLGFSIPIVIGQSAYDHLKKRHPEILSKLLIKDIMPTIKDENVSAKIPASSGHHATIYALENENATKIFLWGMDSFWKDSLQSSSDAIFRPHQKAPRINPRIAGFWRVYWDKIFKSHTNTEFVICTPEPFKINHKNVSLKLFTSAN